MIFPSWAITSEYHKCRPCVFRDKQYQGAEFFYAIRRADGSLLFRTAKLKMAEEIVDRLFLTHTKSEADWWCVS